jgi:GxxExxY protein
MEKLKHSDITGKIIKGFYNVYNSLGYGFLEKVYENSMVIELRSMGLSVEQQKPIAVYYRGALVGEYFTDLLVDGVVIVELKSAEAVSGAHEAQLLNYLKATSFEIGLLLNFGKSAEYKRKICENRPHELLSVLFEPR